MADSKVVSTMALVLEEFLNQVESAYSNGKMTSVYDEQQTIESALTRWRSMQGRNATSDKFPVPLFTFRRSVMRPAHQGMGRRSVVNRCFQRPPNTEAPNNVTIYKAFHGEFDVEYKLYIEKEEEQEKNEIGFLVEESVTDVKALSVEISDLGDPFEYYLIWGVPDAKEVHQQDLYYKVLQGKVTIQGWFFSLIGAGKVIEQINFQIQEFNKNVLMNVQIT